MPGALVCLLELQRSSGQKGQSTCDSTTGSRRSVHQPGPITGGRSDPKPDSAPALQKQAFHFAPLCAVSSRRLLVVAVLLILTLLLGGSLLGGLLLLLVLALALPGVPGQRLLKDLEDLLVGDLVVRLVLADVQRRGTAQLGDAVLGNGYSTSQRREMRDSGDRSR